MKIVSINLLQTRFKQKCNTLVKNKSVMHFLMIGDRWCHP